MPRIVGILGVGHVGVATAVYLIEQNSCDEIILFDKDFQKAQAEATELLDTLSYTQTYVKIYATDDASMLAESTLLINTMGSDHSIVSELDEHFIENANAIKEVFPPIIEAGFDGIVLNATSPNEPLTMLIQEITKLPHDKVIGTGTTIDTIRLYRILGLTLQVNPREFEGYVIGANMVDPFIAWSSLSINGFALKNLQDPDNFDLSSIEESLYHSCSDFCQSKDCSFIGFAKTTSALAEIILSSGNRIFPLATYSPDFETYVSLPVVLSRSGVKRSLPNLTEGIEKQRLEESVAKIKEMYASII